jgi:hypothetical protein
MNVISRNAPGTAPWQALGYGLQYTRLTAMLLEAKDGSMCTLEVLDDIAEQTADGRTNLIQSKSAITANPVSDRAIPFWKTLYNWLELVKQGLVDTTRTVFELYISREVDGELVSTFNKSSSVEEARMALHKAREALWGKPPDFEKRGLLPEGLSRYVNTFIEADEELIIPIIVNFRLNCGSGSPQSDIVSAIHRHPVSETRVLDIADKLCGWVKRQAEQQLEKGLRAVISRDEFHHEYVSYVRMLDRDLILTSFARRPSDEEKEKHMPDVFVQQLDLIEFDFDAKLKAISDFLRACWDRAYWSETGDVHEESFKELDENLCRAWENLNRAIGVETTSKAPIERGILLYARCMNHIAKVQGREPPAHYIPGCYHRLADDMVIGWHPNYRVLLGKGGEDT